MKLTISVVIMSSKVNFYVVRSAFNVTQFVITIIIIQAIINIIIIRDQKIRHRFHKI